jgi:transcription initiation factor TFIIIB Brf1 subunit/transcription initiation factor TFIIB
VSEQLPFETAPELVEEIVDELDLSQQTRERARHFAQVYGGENPDTPLNRSPSAIASAAVWIVATEPGENPTQPEVCEPVECGVVALRNAKRLMLDDMGVAR